MSFQAKIDFTHDGNPYLTILSEYSEYAQDVILSAIYNLINLLEIGDHKFDDNIIDHLKNRFDEMRIK